MPKKLTRPRGRVTKPPDDDLVTVVRQKRRTPKASVQTHGWSSSAAFMQCPHTHGGRGPNSPRCCCAVEVQETSAVKKKRAGGPYASCTVPDDPVREEKDADRKEIKLYWPLSTKTAPAKVWGTGIKERSPFGWAAHPKRSAQ